MLVNYKFPDFFPGTLNLFLVVLQQNASVLLKQTKGVIPNAHTHARVYVCATTVLLSESTSILMARALYTFFFFCTFTIH